MALPPVARCAVHARACASLASAVVAALLGGLSLQAHAEKADRQQPLTIEADRPSTVDMARKTVVFNGRVVLVQGSLRIRAERMEVVDLGEGHRTAQARGDAGQPADFREKRDGVDEFVEGRAQLIEYDSRNELIRLTGQAQIKRLRGNTVSDEIQGETIVWDGAKEFFSVAPAAAAAGTPAPRVRAVLSPAPAPGAAPAASSTPSAPSASPSTPRR